MEAGYGNMRTLCMVRLCFVWLIANKRTENRYSIIIIVDHCNAPVLIPVSVCLPATVHTVKKKIIKKTHFSLANRFFF